MIIKTPISSNQELIPDIFLAGGVTYSPNWQKEALEMLDIMNGDDYDDTVKRTREIASAVADVLSAKGLELYDIKFEFGKDMNGKVLLIDEIAGGNMRAYKDGEYVDPVTLTEILNMD